MKQYLDALQHILDNGEDKDDRTGVGTKSVFGYQMRFNLREGFPAVTTKKLAWKSVVGELLWMLEGSGNERRLAEITHDTRDDNVNTIWTANLNAPYWASKTLTSGDLGRVYGIQWRSWRYTGEQSTQTLYKDQITDVIANINENPSSRRHIVTAWNPAELDQMALPPCHMTFQFNVNKLGELSCQLYQRSCDMFLGVPFNIASYSLLTHIIARECDLYVGDFIWTGGDCHIYNNHIDAVTEQLTRTPKELPELFISVGKKWDDYNITDFILSDYDPMPSIKAEMAV
jgi:thymidylate synthase